MSDEFTPHWTANGESDIFRRLPKMRQDELARLALLLDNERGLNNRLSQYRTEIAARQSALGREVTELRQSIGLLRAAATRRKTVFLKKEQTWKRQVKAARRKALQDVCDVLNYKRRK